MSVLATKAEVRFGTDSVTKVDSTVRLAGASLMHCCAYPDSAPVLTILDAHVEVSVTVPDRDRVTADDVARGRELAAEVGRYVAELERRAAATGDSAVNSDGAGRAA
jgi:hypothetical protein